MRLIPTVKEIMWSVESTKIYLMVKSLLVYKIWQFLVGVCRGWCFGWLNRMLGRRTYGPATILMAASYPPPSQSFNLETG